METLQRPARTVDAAADVLRRAILRGRYPAGGRLPPERALATTLGINRLTLRAALARLESEGLVRARQGDGVLVLDWRTQAALSVLAHVKLEEDLVLTRGVLELRRVMGAEAVALACERASDGDIAALEVLARAQEVEKSARVFAERDLEFGRAVLVAAGNPAMVLLLNAVEGIYRAHPRLVRALHQNRAAVAQSYHGVVALLRARDGDNARRVVRQVLEFIDGQAVELLQAQQDVRAATPDEDVV